MTRSFTLQPLEEKKSIANRLTCCGNKVHGTRVLCQAVAAAGMHQNVQFVGAPVYGPEADVPYAETMERGATTNPYGALAHSELRWSIALLRYFHPIGTHPSGMTG